MFILRITAVFLMISLTACTTVNPSEVKPYLQRPIALNQDAFLCQDNDWRPGPNYHIVAPGESSGPDLMIDTPSISEFKESSKMDCMASRDRSQRSHCHCSSKKHRSDSNSL